MSNPNPNMSGLKPAWPGNQLGRGKRKTRTIDKVMKTLDRVLSRPDAMAHLFREWSRLFDANPAGFVDKVVLPLIGKEMAAKAFAEALTGGGDGSMAQRLTIVLAPMQPPEAPIEIKPVAIKIIEGNNGSSTNGSGTPAPPAPEAA